MSSSKGNFSLHYWWVLFSSQVSHESTRILFRGFQDWSGKFKNFTHINYLPHLLSNSLQLDRVRYILTQWSVLVFKWHSACGAQENQTPTEMCCRNQLARPPNDWVSASIPCGLSTLLMGHMCWELCNIKHGKHFL